MTGQQLTALNRANRVRLRRARDKREIAALPKAEALGMCADILETVPAHWERAVTLELLTAAKGTGRYVALGLIRKAGVQEGRFLCELTARQRTTLAGLLRPAERIAA